MQDDAPILDVPLFIIAFDRPDYLRRLCASLKAQQGIRIPDERLHLIQDGAVSPRSGLVYGDAEKIAASVAVFREHFPGGHVHAAEHNLGIAMNIYRAEQLGFVEQKAPLAYFFEDDLELGPFYMTMMEHLRCALTPYPNVGYFAAYGRHEMSCDPDAPQLVAMGHLWGFGLFRRCWAAMQPLLQPFFQIYGRVDYAFKPQLGILSLYRDRPVAAGITSQDAARTTACAELGFARVQTDVCYARYIGEQGTHFRPDRFADLGFDRMTYVEHLPARMPPVTPEVLASIQLHQRQHFETHRLTRFDAELAEVQRTTYDPDRPITREELEWLWRLTCDRQPPEHVIEDLVGKQTLRKVRRDILRSRDARARCFHMV